MAHKKAPDAWMTALGKTKITVQSARDAMQVKGWLDTGNYALNWAISGRLLRGYPLGHTVEIFGDPATGKSFLATRALAMAQEVDGVALLDDTEGAYNLEHTAQLGVDTKHLGYKNSRTVKEHLATANAFVDAYTSLGITAPGVLVCDSLAQLSTEHELETQLDKRDMTKAAELKAFFRIIAPRLYPLPVLHLSTNHTIAAIGSLFQTRTTPGGGGPKFQSSIRIDLRATSKIKAGADYVGVICRAFIDKNRIVAPWKEVRLAIPFDRPISRASGLVPLLVALGVLTESASGVFVEYGKERLGRANKSRDQFLDSDKVAEELLAKHPKLLEEVDQKLEEGQLAQAATVETPAGTEEEA